MHGGLAHSKPFAQLQKAVSGRRLGRRFKGENAPVDL
jgi:hypothetical protein